MDKILEKSCKNCLHKWVFPSFDPCHGCWDTAELPNWEPRNTPESPTKPSELWGNGGENV